MTGPHAAAVVTRSAVRGLQHTTDARRQNTPFSARPEIERAVGQCDEGVAEVRRGQDRFALHSEVSQKRSAKARAITGSSSWWYLRLGSISCSTWTGRCRVRAVPARPRCRISHLPYRSKDIPRAGDPTDQEGEPAERFLGSARWESTDHPDLQRGTCSHGIGRLRAPLQRPSSPGPTTASAGRRRGPAADQGRCRRTGPTTNDPQWTRRRILSGAIGRIGFASGTP
jgi:hypothetical protein